jgi:hypothetical protein
VPGTGESHAEAPATEAMDSRLAAIAANLERRTSLNEIASDWTNSGRTCLGDLARETVLALDPSADDLADVLEFDTEDTEDTEDTDDTGQARGLKASIDLSRNGQRELLFVSKPRSFDG